MEDKENGKSLTKWYLRQPQILCEMCLRYEATDLENMLCDICQKELSEDSETLGYRKGE